MGHDQLFKEVLRAFLGLSSTDELDRYLDRVLTAASLEDIGLGD